MQEEGTGGGDIACSIHEMDAKRRVAVEFGAFFVLRFAPIALQRTREGKVVKKRGGREGMGNGREGMGGGREGWEVITASASTASLP